MEKQTLKHQKRMQILKDFFLSTGILGIAVLITMALSGINDDNNPFAMAIFILAVAMIARVTHGHFWGIAASVIGTFCVNYIFTYPFWAFDITYPGYPLTIVVMLVVSILISTLTTQIKRQEQLHFEMEREKMHANLLRAIAHDIRTPLSSILGASSALRDQKLTEKDQKELVSGIHRDARWLVRLTENLLSVTRFSHGDVKLKKEDEVLEEIIGSAVLKYHQNAGALPVSTDTPEEILIVPMDAMLIQQVLINLFENVSAHAKGADHIWLHIQAKPDRILLSVEDNGPGIPPELMPHLMDGGIGQTERKTADDRRNMGIGLSVCSSIIRAHGGTLTAGQSRHGGAKFAFDLPYEEEPYDKSCPE